MLMLVQGTIWAQTISITHGDCYDAGASGCASGGASYLPIDTTMRCGVEFVYTINNWCFDFYDLPDGWYTNEDSSELRIACLDVGEYLFQVYSYLDGPDPGNPGAKVTCEKYEDYTITVVPIDTTWLTRKTCDPDSVGNFVEGLITEPCDCDSTVVTTYVLDDCDEEKPTDGKVYFPTAVSPNNDGINDTYYPQAGEGVVDEVIEMAIYDRWGNWVWRNQAFPVNDSSQGWDGSFRRQVCEQDVFVYWALLKMSDGTERVYKGGVTLVRK
ncbi:MAG: gliding motility-associated C-terminal domain-containing protein [Candidatus Peribacteria bacterium]|nr:MAG: gliding motility-associated C-terminal domain-containing protein [Candidatus Peribacteria bacterium]